MVQGLASENRTNHQEVHSLRTVTVPPDVLVLCARFACVLTFASLREIFLCLRIRELICDLSPDLDRLKPCGRIGNLILRADELDLSLVFVCSQ